jgi:DNA polymerase III subunit delta
MAKSALSFDGILADVRNGRFAPIYFLFGEEPFLTEELEREIVGAALAEHEKDFNLDLVYGAEAEARDVLGLCAGYPVMAQRRVVVVRDFDRLKDNREFHAYAERPNPTCCVVLTCSSKPNLSMHPYRALRQHAASFEAKPLRERDMPRWIAARVERSGYSIEPEALQMLAAFLGTSLRTAAREIEKLETFVGERGRDHGRRCCPCQWADARNSVFELQRAVGQGRYSDAVKTGERLLQQASNIQGECLIIITSLLRSL